MKIIDIITADKPSLSFEVFPPKTSDTFESVKTATQEIALLKPSYMSVTYGAGGGTSEYTVNIAENLEKNFGVPTLAHLSCVSSTKDEIHKQLDILKDKGISNILALRGDMPDGMHRNHLDYHYASELTAEIKAYGGFCIGAACYPESHPESATSFDDIRYLKEKVDAGAEFLVTQMFFDNDVLYNFMYRIREAGINVPVVAGIMPVTNSAQLDRIVSLSGSGIPLRFKAIADRFASDPDAMKQAGIAYATEQIIDLVASGVNNIHIYTMNKPDIAAGIMANLSDIIGK